MANISNAFGEITINANSIDAIKNFIILQREFNKHKDYQTELATFILSDSGLEEDITDYATTTANSQFIYEDKFTASSRWNFENNVKHFLDAFEISNDDSNELKILKEACRKESYHIRFDITDEESGCQLLRTAVATIDYNPKQNIKNYTYEVITSYDYTVENLITLGVYNDDEILSPTYVINHYDDVIYDENNALDNLLMTYKEDILKLLASHPYPNGIYYSLEDLIDDYKELKDFLNKKKDIIKSSYKK